MVQSIGIVMANKDSSMPSSLPSHGDVRGEHLKSSISSNMPWARSISKSPFSILSSSKSLSVTIHSFCPFLARRFGGGSLCKKAASATHVTGTAGAVQHTLVGGAGGLWACPQRERCPRWLPVTGHPFFLTTFYGSRRSFFLTQNCPQGCPPDQNILSTMTFPTPESPLFWPKVLTMNRGFGYYH